MCQCTLKRHQKKSGQVGGCLSLYFVLLQLKKTLIRAIKWSKKIFFICNIFFSVVHFGHGILSYYMLHFLDGEEEPFFFFRKNRFNMKERIMRPIKSGLGLVTTLFLALAFEVAENSPIVIAFFRKNSGIRFFPSARKKNLGYTYYYFHYI